MVQPFRVADGDDPGSDKGGWDEDGNIDLPGVLTVDTVRGSGSSTPALTTVTFDAQVAFAAAVTSTQDLVTDGDLVANTAGGGLSIAEGANARMGTATLVGGTATVATTAVTANSRVFMTVQVPGGSVGAPRLQGVTPGVSFIIQSSQGTDTSTVAWLIVEPA